jgi:hypothetical protein
MINFEEIRSAYDERHGGPFDRGSCDAYYGRLYEPHYYVGATYNSERVELGSMTAAEITAYTAGYNNTHERKDWG